MNRKKRIKKKTLIILLLVVLVLGIIAYFFIKSYISNVYGERKHLKISLNGDKEIILKYNSEYQDLGATAHYKDIDITKDIKVNNDLDLEHIGTYFYTYKIKYKSQVREIKRIIKVVDDEKPSIKLNGREELSMVIGNKYKEYGASAYDSYEGDLSDKIVVETNALDVNTIGSYNVKYTVKDSSGNETEIYRKVNVVEKPSSNQKIAVLNYHFFYDNYNEGCHESICLRMDRFREQLDYLKNNGFYTLTTEEFVDWMYGEIDLPQKSVLLTIDDGAFGTSKVRGNYLMPALEEYKMYATLFLITGWWDIENYRSDYLDVQSHTHDLHYEQKNCGHRSKVNCVSYEELLNDLKASINVVKNTNSFCFPFYEYTATSIKAVKEAGFKVAFVGEYRKASRSDDKYKIPRFPIYDSTSLSSFKSMVN